MTREFHHRRTSILPAGVILTLLAMGMTAPPAAVAGCSHLVTSRADRHRASGLSELLVLDRSVRSDLPADPLGPCPCSGAFCSGRPAAPAAPTGFAEVTAHNWAWCRAMPDTTPNVASFLPLETNDPRPMRRWIAVFRPPRPFPSA